LYSMIEVRSDDEKRRREDRKNFLCLEGKNL
jgi:hypothetical protein